MVDKTPHEVMAGSASGIAGYEIMLLARTSPPTVNSITANGFFGPNNDQAARGDHTHPIADGVRPGFMSTGDRAKIDALSTSRQIPAGGNAGQILQKASGTDYHIAWADAPVGGGGGSGGWVQQNTQSALQSSNPTMALGAMGWETDTGRWKIGDGVTAWNSLAYTDFKRTPATITNPGTTVSFRFRTNATQIITFTTPPAGTITVQAPTSAPSAAYEAEMYFRIQNQSNATVTIAAAGFQLDGDYLISTIPAGNTQEYMIWVLAGVWYIGGGQDLEDGSVGNAQLADIASGRIKGRYTAGTGDVEDLVPNQVRWLIDNAQPNVVSIAANTTLTKAAHQGRYLVCSGAVNLTVDANTDFDQYYQTTIRAEGGSVTVVATATVYAPSGLVIPQYATGVLRRMAATDVYSLEVLSHPKVAAADSIAATTSAGTTTLRLLNDETAPGNSEYYGTNASGTKGFYPLPAGGGSSTLDGLTDVTISSPANDQVVRYNSATSQWINGTITIPGGSGTVVDTISALQGIASPSAGEFVFVRGYSAITDGGGGLFQWDGTYPDHKMVTGMTVASGGSGYQVGQLLWLNAGTTTDNREYAFAWVASIGGGGAVTGLTMDFNGRYSVAPGTSGVAMGTDAVYGTGLTVNLTLASWSDLGTVFPKSGGGAGRWLRRYDPGRVNLKWFGAVGNGTADDTIPIQKAVLTTATVYVPPGSYKITRAIRWWTERTFSMAGEGIYGWNTSTIVDGRPAGTQEPMFHKFGRWMKEDGTYAFEVGFEVSGNNLGGVGQYVRAEKIRFVSLTSIYGSCFELTLTDNAHFEFCCFEAGFRGLTLGQSTFDILISNCEFISPFMNNFAWTGTTGGESNKLIAQRAWGLLMGGHCTAINNAIVGWGTACRMTGVENNFSGARIEVNYHGLLISNTEYRMGGPAGSLLTRSVIQGLSMEANTWAIYIKNMNNCSLNTIGIQGSPAVPPRPDGEYAVYIEDLYPGNFIDNIHSGGTFKYGIVNLSPCPISNSLSSTGKAYGAVNTPLLYRGGERPYFNVTGYATDFGTYTCFTHLRIHGGLTRLDARGIVPLARNMGGSVTIAQGATSAVVAFVTEVGQGHVAFNTMTAVNDGASTLPATTYYYATTAVGWNAEVGVQYSNVGQLNYRSLVVGSGQRADLTFYGGLSSDLVRRVYRGTVPGEFDGYFQFAINTNFSDTGQAFTSYGMPPADGSIPSTAEADADYLITATAQNWNAGAVWVTNRATTGFTINCANAAPAGGGIVSWLLFR